MSASSPPALLHCAVCNDRTNGNHFGVTSCRACAAFFRRSTQSNRKYVCRFGGNCDIGKGQSPIFVFTSCLDIRCCCRACRMNKCYEVGMRADLARASRDTGVRHKTKSSDSVDSGDTPPSTSDGCAPEPSNVPVVGTAPLPHTNANICMPEIWQMDERSSFVADRPSTSMLSTDADGRTFAVLEPTGVPPAPNAAHLDFSQPVTYDVLLSYATGRINALSQQGSLNELLNCQDAVLKTHPDSILQRMVVGYRRLEILRRYVKSTGTAQRFDTMLGADKELELREGNYADDMNAIRNDLPFTSKMVDDYFSPLTKFPKSVRFFCPFIMAERAFRTARHLPDYDDYRLLIDNEMFINFRAMERFCDVPNCKIEPERLAQIITPTFSKIVTMLVNPMRRLQLSEEECVGLLGLLFWNDTLNRLSTNETDQVFEVQQQLIKELYEACKRSAATDIEAAARMGIICNLVPLCVRLANELANCFSLVNMTNAFDLDHFLTNIMPELI